MTESLDALREALGRALDLAAAWRDVTDETLGRTTSGGSAQLDFMHDEMTDLREIYVQSEARVRAEVAAEGRTAMAEHFPPVQDGEWIRPPLDTPFLMECCDCGLVHALSFDHDETGRIIFAASRYEAPAVAKRPLRRGRGQKVTR